MTDPAPPPLPPVAPDDGPPRVYFPELDGMRFVAFALVFLFHQGVPRYVVARWLGSTVAARFAENGWLGVNLFFILSGYLIATLLLCEESRFGRVSLRAFWLRRVLRIWPLYYLLVLLGFVVLPWLSGEFGPDWRGTVVRTHLPAFLAFLGNWSMGLRGATPPDYLTVLWSVCVEEQFYLAIPLLFVAVRPRWRVPLVVAGMAAAVAARGALASAKVPPLLFYYNSATHLDTILSGVLLALLAGPDPRGGALSRWAGRLRWPVYAGALAVFFAPGLAHGEAWRMTWDYLAVWLAGVGLVAVAVTYPGWLRAGLSHPRVVWLGRISYGLYMYHEVALWMRPRLEGWVGWFPFNEYVWPVLVFGLTVGLASASYEYYERPFLKLKRAWTRVPSRPV